MEARVILIEDFKKLLNKPISNRAKGLLRQERLAELDESGVLQVVKNRKDLLGYLGYTSEQYTAGCGWINRMIRNKVLTETLVGINKYGFPEYEYHFLGVKAQGDKHNTISLKKENITDVLEEVKEMSAEISGEVCNLEISKGDSLMKIQMSISQVSDLLRSIFA